MSGEAGPVLVEGVPVFAARQNCRGDYEVAPLGTSYLVGTAALEILSAGSSYLRPRQPHRQVFSTRTSPSVVRSIRYGNEVRLSPGLPRAGCPTRNATLTQQPTLSGNHMTERLPLAATPSGLLLRFVLGAIASLMASVFVVGSASGVLGISDMRTGMAATSLALSSGLFILSRRLLRIEGTTMVSLGLEPGSPRLRQFGHGLVIGTAAFLGIAAIQSLMVGASWDFLGLDGLRAAVVGLVFVVPMVLAEELLFRGVALRYLRAICGDRLGVLLSALLFGGYHLVQSSHWAMGAIFIFLMSTLGGLLFGWATVHSGGLALPLGLHIGGNWVQMSLAGFVPAGSAGTQVEALWRIPVSASDISLLSAPDLVPRIPYIAAVMLVAVLITRLGGAATTGLKASVR